jgi:hypothetical protein
MVDIRELHAETSVWPYYESCPLGSGCSGGCRGPPVQHPLSLPLVPLAVVTAAFREHEQEFFRLIALYRVQRSRRYTYTHTRHDEPGFGVPMHAFAPTTPVTALELVGKGAEGVDLLEGLHEVLPPLDRPAVLARVVLPLQKVE